MRPTMPEPDKTIDRADAAGRAPSQTLSPEIEAEIEAAMADLDQAAQAAEAEAAASPRAGGTGPNTGGRGGRKIRGPRVVQAGREHRTGKVVSVGPNDIFVEFGPKELGVVERMQFKDDELPAVGGDLELVISRYDSNESLYLCARPGTV